MYFTWITWPREREREEEKRIERLPASQETDRDISNCSADDSLEQRLRSTRI